MRVAAFKCGVHDVRGACGGHLGLHTLAILCQIREDAIYKAHLGRGNPRDEFAALAIIFLVRI